VNNAARDAMIITGIVWLYFSYFMIMISMPTISIMLLVYDLLFWAYEPELDRQRTGQKDRQHSTTAWSHDPTEERLHGRAV